MKQFQHTRTGFNATTQRASLVRNTRQVKDEVVKEQKFYTVSKGFLVLLFFMGFYIGISLELIALLIYFWPHLH